MRKRTSLIRQIRQSVGTIALLLTLPVVIGLVMQVLYNTRTQAMLRRMEAAAELKPTLESTLAENLFSVAAGRTTWEESGVERLILQTDRTLDSLQEEAGGSGKLQLTVARRTMDTLEQYALQVRDGMAAGKPIQEMEAVVDEVRNVGRLVADMLDVFIAGEISNAAETGKNLSRITWAAAIAEALLLIAALLYSGRASRNLTRNITGALSSLESAVRRIADGNFRERLKEIPVEELHELADQINLTAVQLEALMNQTRKNQEHLAKAELRILQAQINPHFLYNTLDTIVWQAESGQGEEVVRLTRSLSDFFRISLSAGADWIPVSQEMQHVSAYLSIQKTRYRDILEYEVGAIPEGLEGTYMLKFLLQPLVENALYHGIKARRGGGKITVRLQQEAGLMNFSVADTGKGMTPEQLADVTNSLNEEKPTAQAAREPGHSGFGLRNVDMRIRLYYRKEKGLRIVSGPGGTEVSFTIPIRTREEIDHDESLSRG
ncbi:MAG: sensor histidine kinase [Clostridia bacterium]|nr:sensor histidine kinase [Clostridia bacterium]